MELCERLQGITVLLVEAEPLIRDSVRRFFAKENCALMAVETGEDGLEVIKGTGCDIVIVDARLPGMDGLEFLKRAERFNAKAKKILIIASMTEAVISEAFRLGVHEFIEKPFTPEELEETLVRVLTQKMLAKGSGPAKNLHSPGGT